MEKGIQAAHDEKMDINNPSAVGTFGLNQRKFEKYLGIRSTIPSSPNQKMNIEFNPMSFNGYIDVIVSGGYNDYNLSGKLTKRFHGTLVASGSISSIASEYVEVTTFAGQRLRIGDMEYNSTTKKYFIPVEFITNVVGAQRVAVMVEAFNSTHAASDLFDSSMKSMELTEFYKDTVALPAPVVTYTGQVAFKATQGVSPITVDSTTEVDKLNAKYVGGFSQEQLRKNAISNINNGSNLNNFISEGEYFTTSSAIAATVVNSPTTNSFNLEVSKTAGSWVTQVVTDLLNNKFIRRYNGDLVNWGGWTKIPMPDGTLQTGLNAERTNGIKMFNSLTTPVGGSNGDVWFPPPS